MIWHRIASGVAFVAFAFGCSSGPGLPPPIPCQSTVTCEDASSIGTISGDTGSDSLQTSGNTSSWVHVRVTENDNGWGGKPLHLHAALSSPPSGQFELHTYLNKAWVKDAGLDCADDVADSTPSGATATLDYYWGDIDGGYANGFDDSRDVALEVRNVSGECTAMDSWNLTVQGN